MAVLQSLSCLSRQINRFLRPPLDPEVQPVDVIAVLPPVETLRALEVAEPGAALRVIAGVEARHAESLHRAETALARYWRRRTRRQVGAFVAIVLLLGGGTALVLRGHDAVGLALLLPALVVGPLAFPLLPPRT